MQSAWQRFKTAWWPLLVIIILQAAVLVQAPNERTLGVGIKPVYLHVSLTWVGMILLLLSAILGLAALVTNNARLISWLRTFFMIGLFLYVIGFLVSMYASWLNWGGIPYREPRIHNAINVVVAGIASWILYELLPFNRIKGLAAILPAAFIFLGGQSDRMALHPENPVSTAPASIQNTFFIMFGLAILLAVWLVWFQRTHRKNSTPGA